MFNLTEVVAELKALKEELSQLRKEQKAQTGHLITSNYEATGQVVNAVNKTADTSNTNAWVARSLPRLA